MPELLLEILARDLLNRSPSVAYARSVPLGFWVCRNLRVTPTTPAALAQERAEQTLPVDPKREALTLNSSESSTIARGRPFERGNRSREPFKRDASAVSDVAI